MHTAGLGELVALSLGADIKAQVLYADDSAVMISTNAAPSKIGQLPYLKNSFVVLGSIPRRRGVGQAVDRAASDLGRWSLRRTGKPFRLMFSEDGQLVGVPGGSRSRLESAVARATGGRVNPRGGGDEYWTIARRDLDQVLFCQRIQRPKRREPAKGSLAPDLAQLIVNAVGRARRDDVVLDPFAGTGALIAARVELPFREAICSDLGYQDGSVTLLPRLAGRSGVRTLTDDARSLASIPDDSVDVVVTDPPWGEFEDSEQPEVLLDQALAGIARVLRPGGRIAMLVSRRMAGTVKDTWSRHQLRPQKSYDLLVNGHPATVLVGKAAG